MEKLSFDGFFFPKELVRVHVDPAKKEMPFRRIFPMLSPLNQKLEVELQVNELVKFVLLQPQSAQNAKQNFANTAI